MSKTTNNASSGAKRNPKKIAIIITAIVCAVLIVATSLIILFRPNGGSSVIKEFIAKAENKYEKTYHSFCTLEHDKDINIDGNLDEAVWQNKKWFTNTFINNTSGNLPVLKITGFTTQYGVYLASTVEDNNLVYSGSISTTTNSMWELNFAADNVGEPMRSDPLYRAEVNIDMRADNHANDINIDRAVMTEGTVNSGETKGATLEMFVPWEVLQVDTSKGIPDEFRVMPVYHAVFLGNDTMTAMVTLGYTRSRTSDYFRFNKDGYMFADAEGATVGDNRYGYAKTGNWDISKESQKIIRSNYGEDHHIIFFKDAYGPNFILEGTFIPVGSLGQEAYPKAGFAFYSGQTALSTPYHAVHLNVQQSNLVDSVKGTKNFSKYQIYTLNNQNGTWNQTLLQSTNIENPNATKKEGVKLTVVKYNDKFWYFADGVLVGQEVKDFMDTDVFPAIHLIGCDVIVKNYSCKAMDEDSMKDYLSKQGMYLIDARATNNQGTVVSSVASVKKGGSYSITITSKSGYEVSSVMINDKECVADVRKNATQGVYTINGANTHQKIRVSFKKADCVTLSGKITSGKTGIVADVTLSGIDNRSLRYVVTSTAGKGYSLNIPKGTYRISVTAGKYKAIIQKSVTINKDSVRNYELELSEFPSSVTVNGKVLQSNRSYWNMVFENDGTISTSFDRGGEHKPLWFPKTGSDFAVELTGKYTTAFKDGVDYQPDLMVGFSFNDGTNDGWIYARDTGIVTTNWKFLNGLIPYNVLRYPTKIPVKFGLAKKGDQVYILMDGKLVHQMDWSVIAEKINPKSNVAIGIMMLADKPADIEVSNWKLAIGTKAAEQYIKSGVVEDQPLSKNSLFAKTVTVNGKQVSSSVDRWDLSQEANNVVNGSFAMGSRLTPLYFNKTGSTAIMKATIEYTSKIVAGVDYQPDLFGGFYFSDGKQTGNLLANRTGLCYIVNNKWNFPQGLVTLPVLTKDEQRPVEMTVVLKDNYFLVFFDNKYIYRIKTSQIIPNVANGAELAMGITMIADKTADIRFSGISLSTNADDVANYLKSNLGSAETLTGPAACDTPYARQLGEGYEIGDMNGTVIGKVPVDSETTVFIGDSFFDRRQFWKNFYTESYKGKNAFLAGIGGTRADQWQVLWEDVFAGFKGFSPKNIVINLGTNDVGSGFSPETVAKNLETLIETLHKRFPTTNIYYFGITYRSRNTWSGPITKTNNLLETWCGTQTYAHYVSTKSIKDTDLRSDGLHPELETYKKYQELLDSAGCTVYNKK